MRSLSLAASKFWSFEHAKLTNIVFDVDQDSIFTFQESLNADADVEIIVSKIEPGKVGKLAYDHISSFTVPSHPTPEFAQIVSARYLQETASIAIITRSGEIGTISLDESTNAAFQGIGSIEVGVKCACWSPDDSLVAIITGEDKLLLMTSTFEVLVDTFLDTNDKGEDQPVNVGWGSKQTQFHGSLGKSAAQAPIASLNSIGSSPDDDEVPRISWRGDGGFFVISAFDLSGPRRFRKLRVYDRQGILQTVSEPVAGLEHTLCWRPSGNLIASTQRFGFDGGGSGKPGRHDVVFFERNGLRHGEFGLREQSLSTNNSWGYKVRELIWNSDSNILAVWVERQNNDIVQLWTVNNYHWYLKQEFKAALSGSEVRLTSVIWHPEIATKLYLITANDILEQTLTWETHANNIEPPNDTGIVAVVDGTELLLTTFRTQNVPPPMSSHQLSLAITLPEEQCRTPVHVALSQTDDSLCILFNNGAVELWNLRTRIAPGKGKPIDPVKVFEGHVNESENSITVRQLHMYSTSETSRRIVCLSSNAESDVIDCLDIDSEQSIACKSAMMRMLGGRLVPSSKGIIWQSNDGLLNAVRMEKDDNEITNVSKFPAFCVRAVAHHIDEGKTLFVGLDKIGRLYVARSDTSNTYQLVANCNSFTVASGFVIFVTTSHEALFAPISVLDDILAKENIEDNSYPHATQWERRSVERGSRIVTAIPSTMALVLQMPRGNLETIYPRPLILSIVRKDLDAGEYRTAFEACRRHRVDLNIFIEHDEVAFFDRLSSFVQQISDVEYLNLFLTNIGLSKLPATTVTKFCDAIRMKLEENSLTKYIHSVLTAHVVKNPPDHEAALSLLLRLREENSDLVEDAVKYIIFLADADKLFDIALGMYDFSLVLLIAQFSQRDPREYLPFLRELRSLPKYYQRFKIDDHLKRHESALKNLALAGEEYLDEALKYVEKHKLYHEAMIIWEYGNAQHKRVLDVYGEYLFERREFSQAALAFVHAEKISKALIAYERALLWRELFSLATGQALDADELSEIAYRLAEELSSKERYLEASQVLVDYAEDASQAVVVLAGGGLFSEARRLISLHALYNLIEEVLYPASLDCRTQINDDLEEMRTQLDKQVERLHELRTRKIEEPAAFYEVEESTLQNVDVMTDVSMAPTAFTRYTVAPSNLSKSSKQSSRSKKKKERKFGSGRKGTADEEEYLLRSLEKLVIRFTTVQSTAFELLPHLSQFSPEHQVEARSLREEISIFKNALTTAFDDIWQEPAPSDHQIQFESWAARLQDEKRRREDAISKIMKPKLNDLNWDFVC